MSTSGRCPECGFHEDGWQTDCKVCGRILRVRVPWQLSRAMRGRRAGVGAQARCTTREPLAEDLDSLRRLLDGLKELAK